MAPREREVNMDTFTAAYVDCALWVFELDGLGIDLPDGLQEQAEEDCKAFQESNWQDLAGKFHSEEGTARAGHDFYLTRERHGAGFWDGDYPHDVGSRLTESAQAYGSWDEFTAWAMEEQERETA